MLCCHLDSSRQQLFNSFHFHLFFLHLLFRLTCDVYLNYLHAMWSLFSSLCCCYLQTFACKHVKPNSFCQKRDGKSAKNVFFPPHSHDSFFMTEHTIDVRNNTNCFFLAILRSFQNQHTKVFVKYLPSKNIIIIKMKDRNNERMREGK